MIREGEWEVPESRIPAGTDFLLFDGFGNAQVAVEVKRMPRTSAVDLPIWATAVRRNLLAHVGLPSASYFLLFVFPSVGYPWGSERGYDGAPDYAFDLSDLDEDRFKLVLDPHEGNEWTANALRRLLNGETSPKGPWWTESGLAGLFQSGDLRLTPGDTLSRRAA